MDIQFAVVLNESHLTEAIHEEVDAARKPQTQDVERQKEGWRRERDSNPRYPLRYNGFQDRLFQPLTHPSARGESNSLPAIQAADCHSCGLKRLLCRSAALRYDLRSIH